MTPDHAARMKLHDVSEEINRITGSIVQAAIQVHKALGPGLLERVYRRCLQFELEDRGHHVSAEEYVPVRYRGRTIHAGYRLDLFVDDLVVVETKAVERVLDVHSAQLWTYLKLRNAPAGLLINFNTRYLRDGLHRMINSGAGG